MFLLSAQKRWNSRLNVINVKWNHLPLTKAASASSFVHLLVETFPNFREIFQEIVTPCRLVLPQSGFSDSIISSRQFCCSIREWEFEIFTPFQTVILLLHWAFEHGLLTRPKFPTPQWLQPDYLSIFLTASNTYPRNIPSKTLLPNWWSLDCSCVEIIWFSTVAPNGIIGPLNGSPNRRS